MDKDLIIKNALTGIIIANNEILNILENSIHYKNLRSWFNPGRCGIQDQYLATLNPNITKLKMGNKK